MLEFVTWFIWLGMFAILQRRFCRRYPGVRSAFRKTFGVTAFVAVTPGVWMAFHSPHRGLEILKALNHYFGLGIYAQTSLRAMIQLRWLALAPISFPLAVQKEQRLMAFITSLPRILGNRRQGE
ncbi:MAG TPA: hypothetical protein VG456_03885 [Candidatus Sulfopaludibacter sp.]|jgi:hypothetical protein|nr:hypothetical protein [Candidatus Sulfopaludibacter sp.]